MNNIERNIYHIQTTFKKIITTTKYYCKIHTDELTWDVSNPSSWPDFTKKKIKNKVVIDAIKPESKWPGI
jgi:hypothetical protein